MKKLLFLFFISSWLFAQNENARVLAHSKVSFGEMVNYDKTHKSVSKRAIPIGKISQNKSLLKNLNNIPKIRSSKSGSESRSTIPKLPIILQNGFLALADNNTTIPPDVMGAVGPEFLMTTLNSQIRIQDKTGAIISTISLDSFWASITYGASVFDPKIIYDADDNKFIFVALTGAMSSDSAILLAVSQTTNPTSNWFLWKIDADPSDTDWADFPSPGFNAKWIALSFNMFAVSDNDFDETKMWIINKARAYTNDLNIIDVFDDNEFNGAFTVAPCVTFGHKPNLYTVALNQAYYFDEHVIIGKITGDTNSPAWNIFFDYDIDNTYNPDEAPQLGGSDLINNGDSRISSPPVFRFSHIFFCYTGNFSSPNRNVIVWAEVKPSTQEVINQGFIQNTNLPSFFAYPSIAVNCQTSFVIGFSGFSTGIYASAYYTGRQAGDPKNFIRAPKLLKAGEDYYFKDFSYGDNRWGDYSATCVDPADDFTFWTLQEFARPDVGTGANDDRWGTWWGEIYFVPEPVSIYYLSFIIYYLLIKRKV